MIGPWYAPQHERSTPDEYRHQEGAGRLIRLNALRDPAMKIVVPHLDVFDECHK